MKNINITKGVLLVGGLYEVQKSSDLDLEVHVPLKWNHYFHPMHLLHQCNLDKQFLSRKYVSGLNVIKSSQLLSIGNITWDNRLQSLVKKIILFPSVANCESQLRVADKQVHENILPPKAKKDDVDRAGNGDNGHIAVILHDVNTGNESSMLKGLHIAFSWTLFASMWSSMIMLPVVTVWKIMDGAWHTVATIVGSWLCSLCINLPSSHELRRFIVEGLHKWFPHVDIIYEQEPPTSKTIFCCHPHGVFSVGTAMLLDDLNYRKLDDGTRREVAIVTAPFLRWCNPIFKFITDLTGIPIHGAGKNEFQKLLESGTSFTLVPGGFHEATISCVGKERVFINNRKGFIKYALRHGYSVTPVYVFGESDLYHNPQGMMEQRLYMNNFRFQIPGVLPFGHSYAPLAPRRIPLRIVCGKPIELPFIKHPTEDDVITYHSQYVLALEELFYRHVDSYHKDIASKYGIQEKNPRKLERW